ncbi:MAG: PQQ-binding-like beta-propeller repeat protein, partial [Actinomycetota bacterium]
RIGPGQAGAPAEVPLAWVAPVTAPPFDLELLQTTPFVDGDQAYLLDGGGTVIAIDPTTGVPSAVGQIPTEGINVTVAPAVEAGTAYLVAGGRLLAVELPSGAIRWERPVPGMAMRPPLVADGAVVVALEDDATHRLLVVDAEDGEVRWERETGSSEAEGVLFSPLVVTDGLVVAGDPVSAWALDDGQPRWRSDADHALGGAVALQDGTIAAAVLDVEGAVEEAAGSALVVLDAATGEARSRTPLEGVLVEGLSDLALADGVVVAQDAGRVRLLGVDVAAGELRWDVSLPARRFGAAAVLEDGNLWAALLDGRLVAIDPAPGEERARSAELGIDLSDGSFVQHPLLVDGVVVVAAGLTALGVSGAIP